MHTEIYAASAEALKQSHAESSADRAAKAVLTACKVMTESGMMDFMERDVACLLRKIPMEVQEKHYHSDEVHMVRDLFLTVSHKNCIGQMYPQV